MKIISIIIGAILAILSILVLIPVVNIPLLLFAIIALVFGLAIVVLGIIEKRRTV